MIFCLGGQHPNASIECEISPTFTSAAGMGGGHVPIIGGDMKTFGIQATLIGRGDESGPNGVGVSEDVSFTCTKTDIHAVAFSSNMSAPDCQTEVTPTLKLGGQNGTNPPAVAFSIMSMNSGKDYKARETDVSQPLMTAPVGGNQGGDYIKQSMQVRRLTTLECERLQGFPDGYTDIMPNGKPTPDGPRYKALGNSMATNCMEWIGMRIQMVEDILDEQDDRS